MLPTPHHQFHHLNLPGKVAKSSFLCIRFHQRLDSAHSKLLHSSGSQWSATWCITTPSHTPLAWDICFMATIEFAFWSGRQYWAEVKSRGENVASEQTNWGVNPSLLYPGGLLRVPAFEFKVPTCKMRLKSTYFRGVVSVTKRMSTKCSLHCTWRPNKAQSMELPSFVFLGCSDTGLS